jgi:asparagine synthase (glutamine-hydrolysing)
MCGIAGFWNLRSGRPAGIDVVRRMTRTLAHRGPDDEGCWADGEIALGMRRLAVIEPAGGRQPMSNEDGTVTVLFNGEIYDHPRLRNELRGYGHQFRDGSDTEVIVRAWEQWGVGCLDRFDGMFAIAIFDSRSRELLLARDRMGIKPLYVFEGPDGVVFGSELKAVMASGLVPCEIDLESVDDFMTYEYVPAPRSIVRGVEKLRPAHRRLYSAGNPDYREEIRYWRLQARDAASPTTDFRKAANELRERLGAAVRKRLISDVPLGAFLSGGIDSSAIVAAMAAERDSEPVRTFSMGFADHSYDERTYAHEVASHFSTDHLDREVTPDVVGLAETISRHFDEPFADVSAFPTYWLSSLTRERVTVALSGDGGDELLAGYDHYRAHRWAGRISWLARTRGWRVVEAVLDRVPPPSTKKGPVNLAKRFVEGLRRPEDLEHARWWVFWDLDQRRGLYSTPMIEALGERDCFGAYRERLREATESGFSGLQRQLYADITGYLPDDILTKVDRMSMAVGLEARVPFLDHEFVEAAMALPPEWKLRGGTTKWILRQAMDEVLPARILARPKEGFSIPMKNWLRGPLRPLMAELVGGVRERGWFEGTELDRLVDEHLRGRENHAHRLWCLMSLELSLRTLERSSL